MDIIDQILQSQSFRRLATAIKTHNAPDVAILWRSTGQTIANATATAIIFDTVVSLSDSAMWTVGNPTQVVARHAGLYEIGGFVGFVTSGAGFRAANITRNGIVGNDILVACRVAAVTGSSTRLATGTRIVSLNTLDYIELVVNHNVNPNLATESLGVPPLSPFLPLLFMRGPL
jgi:hypothetical protein